MDGELVVNLVVGLVGAVGGGAITAYIARPAAQVAAEQERQRFAQRRKVIDDARAVVAFARGSNLDYSRVAQDRRYMAVAGYISPLVSVRYDNAPPSAQTRMTSTPVGVNHRDLRAEIDLLERRWGLVDSAGGVRDDHQPSRMQTARARLRTGWDKPKD